MKPIQEIGKQFKLGGFTITVSRIDFKSFNFSGMHICIHWKSGELTYQNCVETTMGFMDWMEAYPTPTKLKTSIELWLKNDLGLDLESFLQQVFT